MNLRRVSALLGASALIAMGGLATACSPRSEQPAQPSVPSSSPPALTPTDKNMRTNVTRTGEVARPRGEAHNSAVPCGFGASGGLPCS